MTRRDYINTSILTRQAELREVQQKKRWRLTTLHGAIIVSLAIHAVLLTIRFVDPERFNRIFEDTPLEVILVNAKTTERAVLAQAIAQANLAGGGEAAAGRATSPLPPAATMSLPPRMPSEPMPVRITDMMPPCQTSMAELNSGSTAGLQKFTGGPSSSAIAVSAPWRATRMWRPPGAR